MRAPMPPIFGQEPSAGERGQGHGARLLRTLQAHGCDFTRRRSARPCLPICLLMSVPTSSTTSWQADRPDSRHDGRTNRELTAIRSDTRSSGRRQWSGRAVSPRRSSTAALLPSAPSEWAAQGSASSGRGREPTVARRGARGGARDLSRASRASLARRLTPHFAPPLLGLKLYAVASDESPCPRPPAS
jgi:hypothetical protein